MLLLNKDVCAYSYKNKKIIQLDILFIFRFLDHILENEYIMFSVKDPIGKSAAIDLFFALLEITVIKTNEMFVQIRTINIYKN